MGIYSYKTKSGESRYKAEVWQNNERISSKTFNRKIDAKEWYERQQVQARDFNVGRLKGKNVTFADFFNNVYWPNKGIREGTSKDYQRVFEKYFEPKFGDKKLVNLTDEKWARLINDLVKKGMGHARANRVHAIASAVMNLAYKWKYVSQNPLLFVPWFKEDIKKINFWNFDEADSFLNWTYDNSDYFAVYHTTYELGLRMEEIVGLHKNAINNRQKLIHIKESYCKASQKIQKLTKSGHERILALNDGLLQTLKQTIKKNTDNNYVFSRIVRGEIKRQMLTHDSLRHHFKRDQIQAGIPNDRQITFHELRHTFASHFVMRGGNIYDLKSLLGHSSIETTMQYAHLSPEHLHKQAALVSFTRQSGDNILKIAK